MLAIRVSATLAAVFGCILGLDLMIEAPIHGKLSAQQEDMLTSCIFGSMRLIPPTEGLMPFLKLAEPFACDGGELAKAADAMGFIGNSVRTKVPTLVLRLFDSLAQEVQRKGRPSAREDLQKRALSLHLVPSSRVSLVRRVAQA